MYVALCIQKASFLNWITAQFVGVAKEEVFQLKDELSV